MHHSRPQGSESWQAACASFDDGPYYQEPEECLVSKPNALTATGSSSQTPTTAASPAPSAADRCEWRSTRITKSLCHDSTARGEF